MITFDRAWNFIKDPNHSGAVIAILTLVIVFSNVGYDIVASRQLSAMNGQLSIMEYDERAWVGIRAYGPIPNPVANTPLSFPIVIGNFGKSPAYLHEVVYEARPMVGEFPDEVKFTTEPPVNIGKEKEPVFPGDAGFGQMTKIILTDEQSKTER